MTAIQMIRGIQVGCDGNWDAPEVQISGTSKAIAAFGQFLMCVADPCMLKVPRLEDSFYPVELSTITLEPSRDDTERLTVAVDKSGLILSGSTEGFRKLGGSLGNFFDEDTQIGQHVHFDYYEGNPNLNETNCSLIFMCDR